MMASRALWLIILLCMALSVPSRVAIAVESPEQPVLRLETGMHTAMVRALAADRTGTILATASDDKTVRVWDISGNGSGGDRGPLSRPVRVLRPPLGAGNEGKLYAVAVTPDGSSIACGGWTGWDKEGKGSVYLFDRGDGSLSKRLSGFPEVVKGLAFSPDGAFLAVALGGKGGLYVLRTAGWKTVFVDRDYGGDLYGLSFSRDGRLVTASWDGWLRLYDRSLRPAGRRQFPDGSRPYGIAFSPDGGTIAVGNVSSPQVELLSGKDLTYLPRPASGGLTGALPCVAWGADGALYAAGSSRGREGYLLRRWEPAGGAVSDRQVSAGEILGLVSLAGGGVAFAGAAPELGVVAASGPRLAYRSADNADFSNVQPGFRVSPDGATVQFGFDASGGAPTRFSLSERRLDQAGTAQRLNLPLGASPDLAVENWLDSGKPTLNGVPLPLERFETGRSLCLYPDGKKFVLGTDWNLRCYDRHGKVLWCIPAPATVWGVNLARDGKVVVCAFGDGTIRWYRASDGKELLALFPHRDKKRWLLWTASGYYDASPGGEELAGWHLNNGPDRAADFFPVSRFRAVYCRPDVIARVLAAGDEAEAVKGADQAAGRAQARPLAELLPPLVSIRVPADGTIVEGKLVTVSYTLRSPSREPVTGLRVLVNGRPSSFRESKTGGEFGPGELTVAVPAGDSEIAVIAENRYAASEAAVVRVTSPGQEDRPEVISLKPRLYILAVGVGAYPDRDLALEFAAKDARDFAALMLGQKGGLYEDVSVKVLTDAAASRRAVLDGLGWLRQAAGERDTALVFLSGHGITEPSGAYYFLPVDGDTRKLAGTSVVFSDIKNILMSLPGKAVLFVDTCHSGDVMGRGKAAAAVDSVVNELSSTENGVVVFASSTGRQYSLEDPEWGNGAFTKAIVEGVSGKADYTGKGRVTVTSLDLWLSERVSELTEGKQTPTTAKPRTIPDFPLALRK